VGYPIKRGVRVDDQGCRRKITFEFAGPHSHYVNVQEGSTCTTMPVGRSWRSKPMTEAWATQFASNPRNKRQALSLIDNAAGAGDGIGLTPAPAPA